MQIAIFTRLVSDFCFENAKIVYNFVTKLNFVDYGRIYCNGSIAWCVHVL